MDATTIDLLISMLPSSAVPRVTVASASIHAPSTRMHAQAAEAFISQYMRPAFGWYSARECATIHAPFPVAMVGRDSWVYRAYLMQLDPSRFYDKTIAMAFSLHCQDPSTVKMCEKLQAMLLTFNCKDPSPIKQHDAIVAHLAHVAQFFGMPYELVEAYEILFFNVLDRITDAIYIAHEVYPDTRIIEFDENYFSSSSLRDMVRRAGYNHRDKDLTAYLIGIGDRGYLADAAGREDREAELARHFMGNGLILARTNLLNHRSVGLSRTTTLMAATRQGGNTVTEHPLASLSDTFSEQVAKLRMATQEGFMHQQRLDAGELQPAINV